MTPPRPSLARGQEQVPGERVHGRGAGERVAVEVAVDGGERTEVDEHREEHRHRVEPLGEAVGTRGGGDRRRRRRSRRLRRRGRCERRPRREPGGALGEVLVPAVEVGVRAAGVGSSGPCTTTTRQPWRLPPLGAKRATSSTRASVASSTGSAVKSRIAPVVVSAWRSSMPANIRRTPTGRGAAGGTSGRSATTDLSPSRTRRSDLGRASSGARRASRRAGWSEGMRQVGDTGCRIPGRARRALTSRDHGAECSAPVFVVSRLHGGSSSLVDLCCPSDGTQHRRTPCRGRCPRATAPRRGPDDSVSHADRADAIATALRRRRSSGAIAPGGPT